MQMACIYAPAFPLQLLLRRSEGWWRHPVAVVEDDRPQGVITWVNEAARRSGVLPGMRYAAGLSLAAGLRAGVVSPSEIAESIEALTQRLQRFSPDVEPAADEAGIFWLNVEGLKGLFPSLPRWANRLRGALRDERFEVAVVIGFRRFTTYALATCHQGVTIFDDAELELSRAQQVPLARLDLEPKFRDLLAKLGVHTVGQFVRLPERGLTDRFGARAGALHRLAAGEAGTPLRAAPMFEELAARRELEPPVFSTTHLLFTIKSMLPELLEALASQGRALASLHLTLNLDHAEPVELSIHPASPTLVEMQLIDLVRLKLESTQLAAGVEELRARADGAVATREQLGLFADRPRRDYAAANRALARVRAELGEQSVVRARLKEGHLPEAQFSWEPLIELQPACPRRTPEPFLIRRFHKRPVALTPPSRNLRNDSWNLSNPRIGSVVRSVGPYVLSGGWWQAEVSRAYHFVETQRGDLLWIYLDKRRRRWFLRGEVE